MKKFAAVLACGAACIGFCLSAYAHDRDEPHEHHDHGHHGQHSPQEQEGGSIASKVEGLGKMTFLKITDMRAVRRDNLLRIQFTMSNMSPKNEQLYYRFRWLDADGFTVWEEEPWKPELIYGKQNKFISVVSPTFKATDFKLEVQSPHNRTTTIRRVENQPY